MAPTPLLVVSPHLDDAVLSCGQVLAGTPGSVVVTVFAGGRACWSPVTSWDRACGFTDGEDVIAERRAEDARALGSLGASPVWLDHPEELYRTGLEQVETAAVDDLAATIRDRRPAEVLIPLGLHHPDHELTHRIARSALTVTGRSRFGVYADFYHLDHPELLASRLEELAGSGGVSPLQLASGPRRRKRRAIRCYRSQLRGLGRKVPQRAGRSGEGVWSVGPRC